MTVSHLFQASIYELPFAPRQFDKVFCFGVLQHTPDFKKIGHVFGGNGKARGGIDPLTFILCSDGTPKYMRSTCCDRLQEKWTIRDSWHG